MSRSETMGFRTIFAVALSVLLLVATAVSTVLIHRGHTSAGMVGLVSVLCLLELVMCGWAAWERLIHPHEGIVVGGMAAHIAAAGLFLAIWLRGTELNHGVILFPMTLAPLLLIQSQTVRVIHERWLKAESARTVE